MIIIAIDGPSGAGKSTISRNIAEALKLPFLDTGAMYRAVGLLAIEKGFDFNDEDALTVIATEMKIQFVDHRKDGHINQSVLVNSKDVTSEIRTPEVSRAASSVAVHSQVRERLVKRQRNWIEDHGGGVAEGRDVGTVVFPEADLKVFLTADQNERARRRQKDQSAPGFSSLSNDEVFRQLAERDKRDSSRTDSPMAAAPDALIIDTSGRDVDDILIEIMVELRKRSGGDLPMGNL